MVASVGPLLAQAGEKGSDFDIGSIVLGIVGAVIGGWAAGAIFEDTAGVDWIASILAAVVLVLVWRAVASRGRVRT
jgi:uncharacterized membrane protein YeaQ/YmgE (transglycosylase-associated protein family)